MRDIREWIKALRKAGELVEIGAPVDAHLEITEIADRVMKSPDGGKALLFTNVVGSRMPVLINQFGSWKRLQMALGGRHPDELASRISELIELQPPQGLVEKVKALGKLKELASFSAKTVREAPCQEVWLAKPDLDLVPILHCWPDDGGPFITLPLVFSHDPRTGSRNCGMYRIQKVDSTTALMHWQIHKDGAAHLRDSDGRVPVAVAIGTDPITTYAASAPLPPGIDEMMLAGFMRGRPVEMVKCRTNDVEVPANAEIVLEGYVDATDLRDEGPFGDHTGFYTPVDKYPTFHLTGMSMRRDAVYSTTIVGKPPMEDYYLGKATERIFLPLIKTSLPDILDMNMPVEGVFHNCVIVSIRKRYPGHAKKVMNAIWGLGLLSLSRLVVVVDEDVDVQNLSQVAFYAFSNVDVGRDMLVTEGPVDALDHAAPYFALGSKVGFDATRKWEGEGIVRPWPAEATMSDEVRARVSARWAEFGIR
ncbi:MAG TPA: menaquinone biosynthesis decarboxylase [Miltoncostaeales bacterium]|jgi:4-hydroxy-3-polyprenylbenzoate decarboxylase|nr:menaquinone biosynthesis decarboxylase [Miltoncostaeales bacterium]